jgi:hypothetical protein
MSGPNVPPFAIIRSSYLKMGLVGHAAGVDVGPIDLTNWRPPVVVHGEADADNREILLDTANKIRRLDRDLLRNRNSFIR